MVSVRKRLVAPSDEVVEILHDRILREGRRPKARDGKRIERVLATLGDLLHHVVASCDAGVVLLGAVKECEKLDHALAREAIRGCGRVVERLETARRLRSSWCPSSTAARPFVGLKM